MSTTDWTTWLGPAADEMDTEQRERFEAEAALILDRYPLPVNPDDLPDSADWSDIHNDERVAALSATVQHILGETTLDEHGQRLLTLRGAKSEALAAARQAARLAVLDGMPEKQAAERAGLDRVTVRAMVGK